ncbi:MAG: hypothetical protein V7K19_17615 [Nostoc sp.]
MAMSMTGVAWQLEKNAPTGVSQPGELVIRVHLPIIFSKVNG